MVSLNARHACFVPSLSTESVFPCAGARPSSASRPSRSDDERLACGMSAFLSARAFSSDERGAAGGLAAPFAFPSEPFGVPRTESVDAREREAVSEGRRPEPAPPASAGGEVACVRDGGRSLLCEKDLPRCGCFVIDSICA